VELASHRTELHCTVCITHHEKDKKRQKVLNKMAFNKLFVMVPVMLAARKIDGEDPNIVYWLRVAYVTIQAACTLIVVYTYIQASAAAGKSQGGGMIYVSPAPVVSAY
jgi:hypothetical protein